MKNIISIFIFAILLSCCSKDGKIIGNSSNEQLPSETQTGANTVGCLVNGKVFLPHSEGINPEVNCFYQLIDGKYYFTMAFSDLRGSSIETVNLFTAKVDLQINQVYNLNQGYNPLLGGGAEYYKNLPHKFNTNLTKTGELKITKLDSANSIICGTFWFDAENSLGEKVEIRQGRFDWKY